MTQEQLKQILFYCAITGYFTWLISPRNGRTKIGDRAGSPNSKGYRQIKIGGKLYKEHRLAWLYVYGYLPTKQIDHKNGIRDDNRIDNLREATNTENQQNVGKSKRNTSGYTGVDFHKGTGKWRARIQKDGESISLGYYDTPELAYTNRLKAKSELHTFNPTQR